jgi:hypothetical protein
MRLIAYCDEIAKHFDQDVRYSVASTLYEIIQTRYNQSSRIHMTQSNEMVGRAFTPTYVIE